MDLKSGELIANYIKERLQACCSRIEVAGSIRRKRPRVNDIDLVCIPGNQGQFVYALQQLGRMTMGGGKIIRVTLAPIPAHPGSDGAMLDVYIATPESWATLLLVRTGSREHNIKLCMEARKRGLVLHADGSGLFQKTTCDVGAPREDRIAGDTEESIFHALGYKYIPPEAREV